MSRIIPTIDDVDLGEWDGFTGKINVKGWLSKEKTKGQKIPMESTKARSRINVHGIVEMVFHPWASVQYQTLSHAVKSSC